MTTREFMYERGFNQKILNPKNPDDYVFVGFGNYLSKDQARLMHQTYIEGQITALESAYTAHPGISSEYLDQAVTTLTKELEELKKGEQV